MKKMTVALFGIAMLALCAGCCCTESKNSGCCTEKCCCKEKCCCAEKCKRACPEKPADCAKQQACKTSGQCAEKAAAPVGK